jgi:hypoxanthine phosphoribosyltransferase
MTRPYSFVLKLAVSLPKGYNFNYHMEPSPEVNMLASKRKIASIIGRLASEIKKDYQGKNPLLIGILKGSFVFLADLSRALDFPVQVEFMRLSSYGPGRSSPGELKMLQELRTDITGRHVIIVEDIMDSGHSAALLMEYLRKKNPASLRLCVLVDKTSRRQYPVTIDYLGFTVPEKFIVGYGMDWDEKFRNLPYIGYVELEDR